MDYLAYQFIYRYRALTGDGGLKGSESSLTQFALHFVVPVITAASIAATTPLHAWDSSPADYAASRAALAAAFPGTDVNNYIVVMAANNVSRAASGGRYPAG